MNHKLLYSSAHFFVFVIMVVGIGLGSCHRGPYATTDKVYRKKAKAFGKLIAATPQPVQPADSLEDGALAWVGTVNLSVRKPNYVIIHHTAQNSTAQTLKTFTMTSTQVSAHYVIGRDGKMIQMVSDHLRAHHAGLSKWGTTTDLNSSSIGIELDNNGAEPFPDAQIESLCSLLKVLKNRYKIPVANFIAHADIAPTRKPDPANFPWKQLAQRGYGFWYDDFLPPAPSAFDGLLALRVIGYDILKPEAAIIAFKRHFVQTDIAPVLTETDKAILFNLYQKYL